VGLSTTPCWKRVKGMEESGLIEKRVATRQPRTGRPAGHRVREPAHQPARLKPGCASSPPAGAGMPEVMEFHRMSGDVDYLLRVVAADIAGYDRFYKRLIQLAQLAGVSSAFSMEQIKSTTALPL